MADHCAPAEPANAPPPIASKSDDELFELIKAGKLKEHALETQLGDCARAVRLRRRWLEGEVGIPVPEGLPHEHFDYDSVLGACAEMVVGYVPLPVGVAGPLLLNGKPYQIPMATVEGCLIASTRRGCKAITSCGGASAAVLKQGMTRAPVLLMPSAMRAAELKKWMETPENFVTLKGWFESTSRFAKLQSVTVTVAGLYAYPRFACFTGDAMGMNMVSKGVTTVLDNLASQGFDDLQVLGLSGNMCCDKKPAAVNWIEGRGCSVVVEATLSGAVVRDVLKTTVEAMIQLNISKNLLGSAMAGSIGGFNAHAANIVTAVYIATGQDAAQNVESSNCVTLLTAVNGGEDLHVSCTMPSIEVGTVGGGTILGPQKACLQLLGVAGAAKDDAGANARGLAMIVAGAVLAGELSLLAALSAGHLMKAHMALNRKAPAPAANGNGAAHAATNGNGAKPNVD